MGHVLSTKTFKLIITNPVSTGSFQKKNTASYRDKMLPMWAVIYAKMTPSSSSSQALYVLSASCYARSSSSHKLNAAVATASSAASIIQLSYFGVGDEVWELLLFLAFEKSTILAYKLVHHESLTSCLSSSLFNRSICQKEGVRLINNQIRLSAAAAQHHLTKSL